MKTSLSIALLIAAGFAVKASLDEAERYVHVRIVDTCFAKYSAPLSKAQELACYESPRQSSAYRVLAALAFQPQLWKNTGGRCVDSQDQQREYFDCGWWNRVAL